VEPWDGATPDPADPAVVALYDEIPLWSAPFGLALLEAVELRPGLVVLDVGCGTGFPLLELAERLGPTARLHGVDPWAAGMDRLRRKVEAWKVENVVLHPLPIESLTLPEASVDLIVSNNGLNNVPDLGLALAVCARVARPGAQLAFTANLPATMQRLYDAFIQAVTQAGHPELVTALERHVAERRQPTGTMRRAAERAGFEIVDAQERSFRWAFASARALFAHHFIRLAFLPPWRAVVPEEVRPDVFARLVRTLDADAARHGSLALDIPGSASRPAGASGPSSAGALLPCARASFASAEAEACRSQSLSSARAEASSGARPRSWKVRRGRPWPAAPRGQLGSEARLPRGILAHPVEEPPGLCVRGGQLAGGEEQLPGVLQPGQARDPPHPIRRVDHPQAHRRHAERGLGRPQPEVTGTGQLAAGPERRALHHRHTGRGMGLEEPQDVLDAGVGRTVGLGVLAQLPQVVPGAERRPDRLHQQCPDRRVGPARGQGVEQRGVRALRRSGQSRVSTRAPGQGGDAELPLRTHRSRTTSTSPSFTACEGWQRISFTVPASGASTGISIFIDSRMTSASPAATF
jgi:ubiquinone/menaquinone biosynthesis C-methylase UbiE